ncbi:hypothetical protein AURDEDRAFT_160324 [Auricularia subglabra TFB-10046 SS5]|nr:hypothetical protein AURDEDRAFT_160324 [Auricularia subglabra TFB-10046 SS5]
MDSFKNATLTAPGAVLDTAYSAYEAAVTLVLSLRFDGARLLLLGSVMETGRRFWKQVADKVTNSVFTTASFENGDFAYDWIDDYLASQNAWGLMTVFRVTSSLSTISAEDGHPLPTYQAAANQEDFWRWRGH